MPFVNAGAYSNFIDMEGFVPVEFVTSSSPSEYNDNIETENGAIFIMEVYQLNPSGIPYYKMQSVEVNTSTGAPTASAIGGNGTYSANQNSTNGSNPVIIGFTNSNYTLKTFMRVTPIIGKVKILG